MFFIGCGFSDNSVIYIGIQSGHVFIAIFSIEKYNRPRENPIAFQFLSCDRQKGNYLPWSGERVYCPVIISRLINAQSAAHCYNSFTLEVGYNYRALSL